MIRVRVTVGIIVSALVLVGCGGAAGPGSGPRESESRPVVQRTLIIIENALPTEFAAKALAGSSTGVAFNVPATIFNATLAMNDERGRTLPLLAESLPGFGTDSWKVFPDGTMETTYRLKPNLTWHDGQPLTAGDFVFSWQVYRTPEYGQDRSRPIVWMTNVQAPDSLSLVISWSQRFAEADKLGSLSGNMFPPLPRHLLERAHLESSGAAEQFLPNSPFWNADYVGAGPYKLDTYSPGVSIEAAAFDGFTLGRPKVDRLSIRGVNDVNTAMVRMVAGDAHYAADMFRGDEGAVLEQQWGPNGGVILWEALGSRELAFQFRPEYAQPIELATDVRARRAIAHAVDRQSAHDAVTAGHGLMTETGTHPNEDWYPSADREVAKYPHDLRRATQLLEEMGFARGPDGRWMTSRGTAFDLPIWYTAGSILFQQENAIIVDQLKQFGIASTPQVFNTQTSSNMERAQLPGIIGGSASRPENFHSTFIPRAENRWTGGNRGGYSNPELDQLADAFVMAVDPAEIVRLNVDMAKVVRADLPHVFLYYHSRVYAHAPNLKGPKNRLVQAAGNATRNIHEWYWES